MIRPAHPGDVPFLVDCIRGLAAFERLEHELEVDPAALEQHLFGARPACGALIAVVGDQPVGFALFHGTYSTFKTRPCLHLEDLFVLPEHRGGGQGLALLRAVAARAVASGCPRLDWNVLDWNEGAQRFYRRHGALVLEDWRTCRIEGAALSGLGSI